MTAEIPRAPTGLSYLREIEHAWAAAPVATGGLRLSLVSSLHEAGS